ncbi:MAG: HAD family hydrolase [Acidimicrobiia bacterium]
MSSLGGLVWDFDGLILDTETSAFEISAAIFADHGVDLSLTGWHVLIGTATAHWLDLLESALGEPLTVEDRARLSLLRQDRHRAALDGVEVRPGVEALLGEAAAAGVPNVVASSSTDDWVESHLDRLGLRDHFQGVVTRDLVGSDRTKPHPDLFLAAASVLGVAARSCVVLEDSPNGVLAAHAAEMPVVAVPAGVTASLAFPAADLVVGSLAEVDLSALAALVGA